MSKLINDRWVWAPQYLCAGTSSHPNVSFSLRILSDMVELEMENERMVGMDEGMRRAVSCG